MVEPSTIDRNSLWTRRLSSHFSSPASTRRRQLDEDRNLHRTGGVKPESPLDVEGIAPGWVQKAEPDRPRYPA